MQSLSLIVNTEGWYSNDFDKLNKNNYEKLFNIKHN